MTWRDAFGLVGRSLRRRAARSGLTVAAVALAAALLTALVTIAGTAQTRVLSQVTTGGPLSGITVAAAAPDPTQVDQDDATPGPPKPLDDAALQRIRTLKDVRAAYPVVDVPVVVLAPEKIALAGPAATNPAAGVGPAEPFGDSVVGLPVEDAAQLPLTLLAGRYPTPGSLTEVAVTPEFLGRLNVPANRASAVLGSEVEVGFPRGFGRGGSRARWQQLEVVGVAAQNAGSGNFVTSLQLAAVGRDWILAGGPESAARVGLQSTTYSGVFVIADQLNRVSVVRNRITAVGYSTSAPEQLIASVTRYVRVVEIVLAGIGAIALVVAALGITNAQLAAVRERRREVGVLKAIGARDRDVLRIFLLEALVIGASGGIIGAVLGTGVAAILGLTVNHYLASQGVAPLHLIFNPQIPLAAVAGATALAVVAGVLPARRAAHLSAKEAVDSS